MTPLAQKVLEIIKQDNGITQMVAQHYNIGDLRREISRIRKAGHKIMTTSKVDNFGKKYSRWVMA